MKLKRIDRVLTMLDLLLKYLGYHTYWSERQTYDRDAAIPYERPMKEQDRQKCHWWTSIARQELSLDRECCANEIVIGKHFESCANPMEGWTAYRRLTSTCAHAYYHDRIDVT